MKNTFQVARLGSGFAPNFGPLDVSHFALAIKRGEAFKTSKAKNKCFLSLSELRN